MLSKKLDVYLFKHWFHHTKVEEMVECFWAIFQIHFKGAFTLDFISVIQLFGHFNKLDLLLSQLQKLIIQSFVS